MGWLAYLRSDPVPWLLEPVDPAVRLATLRCIFRRPEGALREAVAAFFAWRPIAEVLNEAQARHGWGRRTLPFFGASVGTAGTLYALAQFGTPPQPATQAACELLLRYGRDERGDFAPLGGGAIPTLGYTGIALLTLAHFGFGGDVRFLSSLRALVQTVLHEEGRYRCRDGDSACVPAWIKALAALNALPDSLRDEEVELARTKLADLLLDFPWEFRRRDGRWRLLHYPRYDDSDLSELCHVLAPLVSPDEQRFRSLLEALVAAQSEEGRWRQARIIPSRLPVEGRGRPSRWLTWEAACTLITCYGGNPYGDDATQR